MVNRLGKYIDEKGEALSDETVNKSSPAAKGLVQWSKAMHAFYFVNKIVKPKKAALAEK